VPSSSDKPLSALGTVRFEEAFETVEAFDIFADLFEEDII